MSLWSQDLDSQLRSPQQLADRRLKVREIKESVIISNGTVISICNVHLYMRIITHHTYRWPNSSRNSVFLRGESASKYNEVGLSINKVPATVFAPDTIYMDQLQAGRPINGVVKKPERIWPKLKSTFSELDT